MADRAGFGAGFAGAPAAATGKSSIYSDYSTNFTIIQEVLHLPEVVDRVVVDVADREAVDVEAEEDAKMTSNGLQSPSWDVWSRNARSLPSRKSISTRCQSRFVYLFL
jgi:hypothetical protein